MSGEPGQPRGISEIFSKILVEGVEAMIHKKIMKFENPMRLQELQPAETLKRAGLVSGMTYCDIGAGSGIFAFPACEVTQKEVYALEVSDAMIQVLESRKKERHADNLIIKKVAGDELPFEDGFCDMVSMVTVLHELDDPGSMLQEIQRILVRDGKLLIVEFHRKQTTMGPGRAHRISIEDAQRIGSENDFTLQDKFDLGNNFYALVLVKE